MLPVFFPLLQLSDHLDQHLSVIVALWLLCAIFRLRRAFVSLKLFRLGDIAFQLRRRLCRFYWNTFVLSHLADFWRLLDFRILIFLDPGLD